MSEELTTVIIFLTANIMAGFEHSRGDRTVMWFPKVASVAIEIGDLMYSTGSGTVQLADATSGDHVGVSQRAIASTDSTTDPIPLILCNDSTFFRVETASAVAADILGFVDLTDENTVNRGATAKEVIFITKFISATEVEVCVSAHAFSRRIATT